MVVTAMQRLCRMVEQSVGIDNDSRNKSLTPNRYPKSIAVITTNQELLNASQCTGTRPQQMGRDAMSNESRATLHSAKSYPRKKLRLFVYYHYRLDVMNTIYSYASSI